MPIPPTLARNDDGSIQIPLRRIAAVDGVLANLFHRLRTTTGDSLDDVTIGLPWDDWRDRPNVPLTEIVALVRSQCLRVRGISSVVSVQASRQDGVIVVQPVVEFDSAEQPAAQLRVSDPYLAAGPGPWWTIAGSANQSIVSQ